MFLIAQNRGTGEHLMSELRNQDIALYPLNEGYDSHCKQNAAGLLARKVKSNERGKPLNPLVFSPAQQCLTCF